MHRCELACVVFESEFAAEFAFLCGFVACMCVRSGMAYVMYVTPQMDCCDLHS